MKNLIIWILNFHCDSNRMCPFHENGLLQNTRSGVCLIRLNELNSNGIAYKVGTEIRIYKIVGMYTLTVDSQVVSNSYIAVRSVSPIIIIAAN